MSEAILPSIVQVRGHTAQYSSGKRPYCPVLFRWEAMLYRGGIQRPSFVDRAVF
jgi:hypothetical protein